MIPYYFPIASLLFLKLFPYWFLLFRYYFLLFPY
jgi:hypothetical protein